MPDRPHPPFLRSLIRLRCPHCGTGAILAGHFKINPRCAECGLDFYRRNPAYYSGAVIINYLLSSATTLALFLLIVVLTWPTVPWRVLGFAIPALVAIVIVLMHPVAKVILLTADVRFRDVQPDEFDAPAGR